MHAASDSEAPPAGAALPCPLFVLGTKGRSGTGYLSELLRLHPDCGRPLAPLEREDWLLDYAHHLVRYASSVAGRIGNGRFEPLDVTGLDDALLESIGRGILALAASPCPGATHVAFKTPTLNGIEHAWRLFPRARVIVIVRNGRDSVESSLRSWPTERNGDPIPAEEFTRRWTGGVRALFELMESHPGRFLSVRYEDLVLDLDRRMAQILRYAGLDPARYDFAAAADLPVYGSSSFGRHNGAVTWQPQAKTAAFRPLDRAQGWNADQHRAFNAIAGRMMRALGYPLVETD